jgi:ADP-ribose pyrophosphatase
MNDRFKEKVVRSSCIYRGKVLRIRLDEVVLPNGVRTTREIVEHPGAVAIVPLIESKRVVLVRQYRRAADRVLLEIPAGPIKVGETPLACARRELLEETGFVAERFRKMFVCYMSPGYSTEAITFYLAEGLRDARRMPAKDELLQLSILYFRDALRKVTAGIIKDAKTICALAFLACSGWIQNS